jgi:hypothetical protein
MKTKQALFMGLAMTLIFAGCEITVSNSSGDNRKNAIHLVEDFFENGNLAKDSEQWFSFSVTSPGTYYIHVVFDTLEYLHVRVFTSAGSPVGSGENLWESRTSWYFSRGLSESGSYYIRVQPYYRGDSGTYRIAFNKSATPPSH